jgi:hypothetical protein
MNLKPKTRVSKFAMKLLEFCLAPGLSKPKTMDQLVVIYRASATDRLGKVFVDLCAYRLQPCSGRISMQLAAKPEEGLGTYNHMQL